MWNMSLTDQKHIPVPSNTLRTNAIDKQFLKDSALLTFSVNLRP